MRAEGRWRTAAPWLGAARVSVPVLLPGGSLSGWEPWYSIFVSESATFRIVAAARELTNTRTRLSKLPLKTPQKQDQPSDRQ